MNKPTLPEPTACSHNGQTEHFYSTEQMETYAKEWLEYAAQICETLVINHPGRADLTVAQCAQEIRSLIK